MNFRAPVHQTTTARPGLPESETSDAQVRVAMAHLYDHYFACHAYEKRYPQPNQATLAFLMTQGASNAQRILDFGCGNGRYALALLQATSASVTGCDISEAALQEFRSHLDDLRFGARTRLLLGDASALAGSGRYDVVLMLFGVLSHIGVRSARLDTLRHLRSHMTPGGKLLLTVPSQWRRRPIELICAAIERLRGSAQGVLIEEGNILFSRMLGGESHQFFYHLYTVQRLRDELREAGFQTTLIEAESVLPEWLITQHPWIGGIDARVARLLPAFLGYGIRAVAIPA